MLSPVSCASCSRICLVGFGVAAKAALSVSSCLALMVVLGPRLLPATAAVLLSTPAIGVPLVESLDDVLLFSLSLTASFVSTLQLESSLRRSFLTGQQPAAVTPLAGDRPTPQPGDKPPPPGRKHIVSGLTGTGPANDDDSWWVGKPAGALAVSIVRRGATTESTSSSSSKSSGGLVSLSENGASSVMSSSDGSRSASTSSDSQPAQHHHQRTIYLVVCSRCVQLG